MLDSKWRNEIDFRLVERIIGCTYLNAYLPMTAHAQVSSSREVPFPIREQIDVIRSHFHIEHGRIQSNSHICSGCMCAVIYHADRENIGAETVWIDVERHRKLPVGCVYRCVERL